MSERALTRRAVAERLGCSEQTVRRLVRSGALPPPRQISPGRVGHLESEINEYLRAARPEPLSGRTRAANAARGSAA